MMENTEEINKKLIEKQQNELSGLVEIDQPNLIENINVYDAYDIPKKDPLVQSEKLLNKMHEDEVLVDDKLMLGRKTYRKDLTEFYVFRRQFNESKRLLYDEYNKDLTDYDSRLNKLTYDLFQLPDYVTDYSREKLETNFFNYNYKENVRSFKPTVHEVYKVY